MAELLRSHAPRVALRGSSMGGFQSRSMRRARPGRDQRRRGDLPRARGPAAARSCAPGAGVEFRCDAEACEPWLASLDTYEPSAALGPETALLLMHARGDEQVPYTVSEQLHEAAREPKRLLLMPGGHHRSIQHDEELQAVSRKFIRET